MLAKKRLGRSSIKGRKWEGWLGLAPLEGKGAIHPSLVRSATHSTSCVQKGKGGGSEKGKAGDGRTRQSAKAKSQLVTHPTMYGMAQLCTGLKVKPGLTPSEKTKKCLSYKGNLQPA